MVKKCSTLCSTDQRFIRKRKTKYLENPYFSHSRTGKQKENQKGVDETNL